MSGDWFSVIPAVLVGLAVIYVPGVLALLAIRMRGLALVSFAPVFGVLLVGAAAVVIGLLPGVDWSLLSFAAVALVVVALAWGLRPVLTRKWAVPAQTVTRWPWMTAAIVVGGGLLAFRLMSYIQAPDNISQTNDAVFHLNAIRYIEEIGSASSLQVSGFVGGTGFYPAAWHGVVSLMAQTAGADIPVAANAFTLIIGALIWTTGIAWLARTMSGSTTVAAYAAVLAGTLQTFPVLMFQWGVLYPNALSTALVPAALAIVVALGDRTREGEDERPFATFVLSTLLIGVAAGALLLSQPAAFLAWGLLVAVYLTLRVFTRPAGARLRAVIGAVASWGGLAVVWYMFARSTSGSHWGPSTDKVSAALDMLFNRQSSLPAAWAVSALMMIGLIVALVKASTRWATVGWLALTVLYVISASAGRDFFRNVILGPWYADTARIAALAPVLAIPLAAWGLATLVSWVRDLLTRTTNPSVRQRVIAAAGGGVVASVFAVITLVIVPVAVPTFLEENNVAVSTYHSSEDSYLSIDERAMLDELAEHTEPDAVIIGNPSTGMAFGYALSGRNVFPRTWAAPESADWSILGNRLNEVGTDPAICDALATYGSPDYVLDFGEGDTTPGRWVMPGMTDFEGRAGFEQVAAEGDASLWRITACE